MAKRRDRSTRDRVVTGVLALLGAAASIAVVVYLAAVWLVVAALGVVVVAVLWIHHLLTGARANPTPSLAELSGPRYARVDAASDSGSRSGELVVRLSDSQSNRALSPRPTEPVPDARPPEGAGPSYPPDPLSGGGTVSDPRRATVELEAAEPESEDSGARASSASQITRLDGEEVPAAISRSRSFHSSRPGATR